MNRTVATKAALEYAVTLAILNFQIEFIQSTYP